MDLLRKSTLDLYKNGLNLRYFYKLFSILISCRKIFKLIEIFCKNLFKVMGKRQVNGHIQEIDAGCKWFNGNFWSWVKVHVCLRFSKRFSKLHSGSRLASRRYEKDTVYAEWKKVVALCCYSLSLSLSLSIWT